jgi:hypothetical protein
VYLDRLGERAEHWKWLGGGAEKPKGGQPSPAPAE